MPSPSDTPSEPDAATRPTARPDTRSSGRQQLAIVATAVALAGLLGYSAREPAAGDDPEPEMVGQLRSEVDAMVDSGVPEDHPKVEMLTDEADALAAQWGREGVPEAEVDLEAQAGGGIQASSPDEAQRQAADVGTDLPTQGGPVDCEPLPQHLSADDVAGGRCLTVPQPDGSSLYVVVGPTGAVHAVGFRPGGDVARLPDATLPFGAAPDTAELVPDAAGDVQVRQAGAPLGTLTFD